MADDGSILIMPPSLPALLEVVIGQLGTPEEAG
jgi:hypothetical protein